LPENFADIVHAGPLGRMRDDYMLVVKFFDKSDEFIYMHVSSRVGAFDMLVGEECAFRYHDPAGGDVGKLRKIDVLCISEICYNWDFLRVVDLNTFFLKFDQFPGVKFGVLGFELFCVVR